MNGRVGGVAAVLVSLLVVGVVRAATPESLPTHSHVTANGQGVVALEVADVELLGVRAATRLQSDRDPSRELGTEEVFVVAQVRITPHGGTLRVVSDLRSADGHTYQALDVSGFSYPGVAFVGQRVTQSHIFEVPQNRLPGAHLMIRGAGEDGVQAIQPVAWFPLVADVESGPLAVPETTVESAP